jgi:hypothetical protein
VVLTAEDDPICIHSLCPTTSDQIGKTLFVVSYTTLCLVDWLIS